MIEKTQGDAVSAASNRLRTAVLGEEFESRVADFAVATARLDLRQVRRLLGVSKRRHIRLDDIARGTVLANASAVDPYAASAKILDGRHVVRNEENRTATTAHVFHGVEALLLEAGVADGQDFV